MMQGWDWVLRALGWLCTLVGLLVLVGLGAYGMIYFAVNLAWRR